jgi:hypothetical protein
MASTCLAQQGPVPAPEKEESIPLYRRIIFGDRPKPKPPAPPPTTRVLSQREQSYRTFQEERAVYLQRCAACTKFRMVAEEMETEAAVTNNSELARKANELRRQAEQLEEEATKLFQQRIAHLPGMLQQAAIPADPLRNLDMQLGSGIATDPLRSPAPNPTLPREGRAAGPGERR